jgi:polyhydroxyalkanoate synthesis regulator phasin
MKSLKEKLERIQIAWNEDQHHELVFEWVKTGVLSLSEFREAIDLISQLDEDESRKLWG